MSEKPAVETEAARHVVPADLIHDLRTPLNHIIGYSALLLEQAQERSQGELASDLEKIHQAGQQLLSRIEDNFSPVELPSPRATTAVSNPPLPPVARANNGRAEMAEGRVLVVDDVADNRDVLSRRLTRQGYSVAVVENGREALQRIQAEAFDLVLLDIMMPELDGYGVLQFLKADEALRHIPVIMISALSELDSLVRCIALGAEDYLPKPFEPTLLKARIGACVEKKRARDREQALAAALRAQNREMAIWRAAQEADLAVARGTQQAIVTAAPPRLDGWQVESIYTPLIQVGGDVYGWRLLANGSCLFWLADATGHGVAAALFTTLVALLFDHAGTELSTAHEILMRVNAEFYSVLRGRAFMTACCALVGKDGALSFAGAGHPPLLVRRYDGAVEALPSRAGLIGLNPVVAMDETVTTLAPGDVALLYTDGLYSSKSNTGARLTSNILTQAFAQVGNGAGFLPQLVAQIVQHSGGQAFDDDIAAIALTATGASS